MSKILTIDDSSSIRDMVRMTLRQIGHEVIEAEDGEKGIAAAAAADVDMVITDLNMPNKNGIEVIKALRAMPNYMGKPIIILTTESQEDKRMEGKAAGATGWLVKPFRPEKLKQIVSKLLA